jgi:hypothetical protein
MPSTPQALQPELEPDHIIVESCRKCSFEYKFKLEDGKIVTILCGRPNPGEGGYKALSYVWEDTISLQLKCGKCLVVTTVPMRDSIKFRSIMGFIGGDSRVWIDALSIDQSDPNDKAAQLPAMGEIYRRATTVSVFLPHADSEAYYALESLGVAYAEIVKRYNWFAESQIDKELSTIANNFSDCVRYWRENLDKWRYWRRAWTFQEWAMAREIEITYEGTLTHEYLSNIKNVIVEASAIIGHWKKTSNLTIVSPYTEIEADNLLRQVYLREDLGLELNSIRSLFPFEDFLVADRDEENMEELRASTFQMPFPSAIDSGTYVDVSTASISTDKRPLRKMLALTLNAMGTSKREATYPADLVACWASACNIIYPYNIGDSFAVALHKVIYALRENGIIIYNFLANTDSAETDIEFLKYSAAQIQLNSSSCGYMFGNVSHGVTLLVA